MIVVQDFKYFDDYFFTAILKNCPKLISIALEVCEWRPRLITLLNLVATTLKNLKKHEKKFLTLAISFFNDSFYDDDPSFAHHLDPPLSHDVDDCPGDFPPDASENPPCDDNAAIDGLYD